MSNPVRREKAGPHSVRISGKKSGRPVVFIHGNTSTSAFWEPLMLQADPDKWFCVAPDLNGFGDTRIRPVQAATGVSDWAADVIDLIDRLNIESCVFVCSSLGGILGWKLLSAWPERIEKLVQIAPGSPFGFGGTHGDDGRPNFPDFAGSGAGMSNPLLVERIRAKDRSQDKPHLTSPSWVLQHYVLRNQVKLYPDHPFLDGMMKLDTGPEGFPGNIEPSPNWPGYAPGDKGIVNSISPKYLSGLPDEVVHASRKPPVLWLRGDKDTIVSDRSGSDPAALGKAGLIPDWPGPEISPPQPMLRQTRSMLENYRRNGGAFQEHILPGLGHCPYIEAPDKVWRAIIEFSG